MSFGQTEFPRQARVADRRNWGSPCSTIMTSNRPLEDWGKLLQDVPTAGAVLDRFLHHATVVSITGESYRLKDAALAKSKPKES